MRPAQGGSRPIGWEPLNSLYYTMQHGVMQARKLEITNKTDDTAETAVESPSFILVINNDENSEIDLTQTIKCVQSDHIY